MVLHIECSFDSEITIKSKMNFQNTNTNNFIAENKNRLLFFFLLFLLSSIGMFGQSKEIVVNEEINTPSVVLQNEFNIVTVESQIDFVSWFMGSKQPQLKNDLNEVKNNSSKGITRKQILSLGITPNKVLYRTFMKKVSSQDSAIV